MVLYNFKPRHKRDKTIVYSETHELFEFARRILAHRKKVNPKKISAFEVGKLLSSDYKFAHQWQFGKRRMVDISELEELAQKLEVPFFIVQKIALGTWDASRAWKVYQSYEKGWEVMELVLETGNYRVRLRGKVPPSEKAEIERKLKEIARKFQEGAEDPTIWVKDAGQEVVDFQNYLGQRGYLMLPSGSKEKGQRPRKTKDKQ